MSSERARAAESGFSIYPLGSLSFGAGAVAPTGFYVTPVAGYYHGVIRSNNLIGGVATLGLDAKFFSPAVNFLYAPNVEIFGGHLALSATVPTGCVDLKAQLVLGPINAARETSGCGFGDMSANVQLGWTIGDFSHAIMVTGFAPTGRYDTGFNPSIGLNRPAADVTWAATWTERTTGIQFNGAVGYTVNAENTDTHYKSGDELHFEWAIGKMFAERLTLGIGGYDYIQVTADSGSGATLGPFKGEVHAAGPAASLITKIADHLVIFNVHSYFEFDVIHRFKGTSTLASATIRF